MSKPQNVIDDADGMKQKNGRERHKATDKRSARVSPIYNGVTIYFV